MRERLLNELGGVARQQFLVYLMGPYEDYGEPEKAAFDRLLRVRDALRVEPGVNAFLAIDANVPLDEMDAATQSVEFARASNAVAFVAPRGGRNLGVGIEVGAILERIHERASTEADERVVFAHEKTVRSAMIDSLSQRWNVTVYSYGDTEELIGQMREFVSNVVSRELTGELSDPGSEEFHSNDDP
ncbi:hypothetical protein NGM10_11195 [Halorussus salilacus]|uniref:DUF7509 family protein n=1 Tax=Halorussus salilacus TaxID=2953750 RepID=UPI00209CB9D6|nr:hypothetical protein [Halorussus salilacus]USZ67294.1 hypothetical protein NGM10_11195 [Halorussus salilacus]